jgi:hypothetical protein
MAGVVLLVLLAIYLVLVTPAYLIGQRRGLRHAWAAFIPLLGVWIVLFEAIGKSGWYSLLVFIPYAGPIAVCIWTAWELPRKHARSGWWTLALLVPLVNVVTFWFYALTLPERRDRLAFA